jgi:hypothetical protein
LLALRILVFSDMAIELNLETISMFRSCGRGETYIHNDIVSWKFPRIEVKPVIRNLNLVSVHNFLLENTIAISQSITPCRVVERRKGVQETSSQSAETSISKRSIVLLVNDVFDAETEVVETA